MNISGLKRNPKAIHSILVHRNDGTVKVTAPCSVHIPKRYTTRELATVGNEVSIVGMFGIVTGNNYGVCRINAMVNIKPTSINTIIIDDTEYLEFQFEAGDTLLTNVNLVKRDTLVYRIYDEIVAKGNTPWYMSYQDLGQLFDTASSFGGANLGANHAILEMITASRARNPNDRTKYYRHTLNKATQLDTTPPVMIALKSVQDGATNTTAKLIGAYMDEGINSALVDPSERSEKIEELLRT